MRQWEKNSLRYETNFSIAFDIPTPISEPNTVKTDASMKPNWSLQTVSFARNQVLSSKTASEIIIAPERPTHCHQTQMSVT